MRSAVTRASCAVVVCACATAFLHHEPHAEPAVFAQAAGVTFTDVTQQSGLSFQHVNGASPQKHIVETMGSGALVFDFDAPYQRLYQEMLYGLDTVDYAILPPNFDRYSPADQARIANRVLAVIAAAQAGVDLEAGPFPVATLSLDEALGQLAGLGVA